MAVAWSEERILNFIEMYRNRPVLWDIRLVAHKDKAKRRAAISDLAVQFDVTTLEVERKIKNLLSHYSRELRKIELGRKSPANQYTSKWFCFARMQFLNERHNKPQHSPPVDRGPKFHGPDFQSVKAEQEEGGDPELISQSDRSDNCDPLAELTQSSHSQSVDMYLSPEQPFAFALPEERRANASSGPEDDPLALLREISSLRQERDEFTLFGEQVAVKLRKLASPYARIMVQHIINTTLFEAEMGKYDEPATMTSTVPTFVPPRRLSGDFNQSHRTDPKETTR